MQGDFDPNRAKEFPIFAVFFRSGKDIKVKSFWLGGAGWEEKSRPPVLIPGNLKEPAGCVRRPLQATNNLRIAVKVVSEGQLEACYDEIDEIMHRLRERHQQERYRGDTKTHIWQRERVNVVLLEIEEELAGTRERTWPFEGPPVF